MKEALASIPLMVSIGNHERKSPNSGDLWNSGNDSGMLSILYFNTYFKYY